MKSWLCLTVVALALPAGARAQQQQAAPSSSGPVVGAAQMLLDRYGSNLVAAAREMPADKYGYKPTPQQMSFGEVVSHLAEANNMFCAHASDQPVPAKVPEATAPKDALVDALEKSFTFCKDAVGKVDESKLSDQVPLFGDRKASRAAVLFIQTGDMFDHYSQMSIYLRLNGLLPPTARPKPTM